jgi:hypothetical protein
MTARNQKKEATIYKLHKAAMFGGCDDLNKAFKTVEMYFSAIHGNDNKIAAMTATWFLYNTLLNVVDKEKFEVVHNQPVFEVVKKGKKS